MICVIAALIPNWRIKRKTKILVENISLGISVNFFLHICMSLLSHTLNPALILTLGWLYIKVKCDREVIGEHHTKMVSPLHVEVGLHHRS